jgi:signal transduction histidine kinase
MAQMLSRELHDKIAQLMAAALTRMELAQHYYSTGEIAAAQVKWAESSQMVRRALTTTKDLATRVRTLAAGGTEADHSAGGGDSAAVKWPSHSERREELYLILREAVDNALTHSGAQDVTIRLSVRSGTVAATVADNGTGVPEERRRSPRSLGLHSMYERVRSLGGTFSLASIPSVGTQVSVVLPLRHTS